MERGLSLQNRLHIIEMVQVEDDKVNQITQLAIANANLQLQNILEERKQAIDLENLSIQTMMDSTNIGRVLKSLRQR